jgi:putative tributyrin esterase
MTEVIMAVLSGDFYSKARFGMQTFTAILPVDPPPDGKTIPPYAQGPWPTIYLLHGYSGNQVDWLYRSDIEKWAMRHGYAVIMPSGSNYFFLDNEETKERFGGFVGEELVEISRKMFPLSHKREDTVIAGLSMGGFGAVRNGLRYADTFGAILALSSAMITDVVAGLTPENAGKMPSPFGYYRHTFGDLDTLLGSDRDPKHLAKECLKTGNTPLLFLACGSEDFLYKEDLDYHNFLEEIGYPHAWWVRPGVHDFEFWNQSLPAGLDWLKEQRK